MGAPVCVTPSRVHSGLSSPAVDTTRVALRDVDESVPGSDYINANYIKVRGKGKGPCGGCLQPGARLLVGECSHGVSLEGMPCQESVSFTGSRPNAGFFYCIPRDLVILPCPVCPYLRAYFSPLLSFPVQEVLGN